MSPVLVPVCAPYPLCGVLLLLEHERVDGLSPTTSLTAASPTNRPPSPPATPAAPKWVATGEVVPEERATAWLTREAAAAKFVKVAVDGAPDLRKVNLQDYAGYDQLIRAPEQGGSRTRR